MIAWSMVSGLLIAGGLTTYMVVLPMAAHDVTEREARHVAHPEGGDDALT